MIIMRSIAGFGLAVLIGCATAQPAGAIILTDPAVISPGTTISPVPDGFSGTSLTILQLQLQFQRIRGTIWHVV